MLTSRRKMNLAEATLSKSKKMAITMAVVFVLFGIAWLIQPVFAMDQPDFFDENYQISNYTEMFNYSAPSFDHQPMILTMNGTVNGSPIQMTGEFSGNISVVSRPVGWDLVIPLLVYQDILLTAIAICLVILTGFFLLKLHK